MDNNYAASQFPNTQLSVNQASQANHVNQASQAITQANQATTQANQLTQAQAIEQENQKVLNSKSPTFSASPTPSESPRPSQVESQETHLENQHPLTPEARANLLLDGKLNSNQRHVPNADEISAALNVLASGASANLNLPNGITPLPIQPVSQQVVQQPGSQQQVPAEQQPIITLQQMAIQQQPIQPQQFSQAQQAGQQPPQQQLEVPLSSARQPHSDTPGLQLEVTDGRSQTTDGRSQTQDDTTDTTGLTAAWRETERLAAAAVDSKFQEPVPMQQLLPSSVAELQGLPKDLQAGSPDRNRERKLGLPQSELELPGMEFPGNSEFPKIPEIPEALKNAPLYPLGNEAGVSLMDGATHVPNVNVTVPSVSTLHANDTDSGNTTDTTVTDHVTEIAGTEGAAGAPIGSTYDDDDVPNKCKSHLRTPQYADHSIQFITSGVVTS